jgi:hypothetical protein
MRIRIPIESPPKAEGKNLVGDSSFSLSNPLLWFQDERAFHPHRGFRSLAGAMDQRCPFSAPYGFV